MNNTFDLIKYLNDGIRRLIQDIAKSSIKHPQLAYFLWQRIRVNRRNEKIRLKYEKNNVHIPAFLIASITNQCNLHCVGCYARSQGMCIDATNDALLTAKQWGNLFYQAELLGISFCLLAGGEPMLRPEVIYEASQHKSILFPIFTNGTLIGPHYTKLFRKHRHLIPIVSIEGNDVETDARRGEGISQILHHTLHDLHSNHILYGVSITVTTQNLDSISSPSFISELVKKGCRIVFLIEYVPIEANTQDLAFTEESRHQLESVCTNLKNHYPDIIFLAFPGDEKKMGGCLAGGRGFFHINPTGDGEACPFAPYSDRNLKTHTLLDMLASPLFKDLIESGLVGGEHDGGCALFQQKEKVESLFQQHQSLKK